MFMARFFFFSSRRRHTRYWRDWSSDVCSSDLIELEFTEGMQFDKGYISPYFITDQDRMEGVYEDPYLLIVNKKVSSAQELLPVLEKVLQAGKPLLVIAEDVRSEEHTSEHQSRQYLV